LVLINDRISTNVSTKAASKLQRVRIDERNSGRHASLAVEKKPSMTV